MRKVCIFIGSRANYSSIKSVMGAIAAHPRLELQLVVGASAVLDRYGSAVRLIEADGFKPDSLVHMLVEGETPATMAKSTGLGLLELPGIFERLRPDVVVTVGDRFETMATTLAAAYMNIHVAHTMGGEVSGTIDESIRHAVTKFAHIHFPASREAAERIVQLGEDRRHVHLVGCPRIDLVAEILAQRKPLATEDLFKVGVGHALDLSQPFVIVSQHPVTTEFGQGQQQIEATLEAVRRTGVQAIVLWPNADAGSEDVARGIRKWRERRLDQKMHFFKNLSIDIYVRLMSQAACLLGNSSSGIREGAFIGTPVVNIGSRQEKRERGHNVLDAGHDADAIEHALRIQLARSRFQMEPIYGDGRAGANIARVLADEPLPPIQKRITY